MFTEYYGFSDEPFRLSPDPRFCYRHPSFAKGGAYMRYALRAAEGFVVITGAPGMGKTTLISDTTGSFGPGEYTVATLVNTLLSPDDVLRSAAYEFGLDVEGLDPATVLHRLKQLFIHCHARQRPPLLVVDEAQNLSLYALEELRMLTNLDLDGKPLLQIFLVGQNQLRDNLQNPALEQLRQRVTAAAHLKALNRDEIAGYLIHRLRVVGWRGSPKLKSSLLPVIELACEGVPRRINQFCNRLFLYGAVDELDVLNADAARVVLAEMEEERLNACAGAHTVVERRRGSERRLGQVAGLRAFDEPGPGGAPGRTGAKAKLPANGLSLISGGLPGRGANRAATVDNGSADGDVASVVSSSDPSGGASGLQVQVGVTPTLADRTRTPASPLLVAESGNGAGSTSATGSDPGGSGILAPAAFASPSLEERKAWRQRVSGVPVQEDVRITASRQDPAGARTLPKPAWFAAAVTVVILALGAFLSTVTR